MHWKPIPIFPKYEASKCGHVRRIGKSKSLSTSKKVTPTNTYLRITLFKEGERHYHQLHRIYCLYNFYSQAYTLYYRCDYYLLYRNLSATSN